MYGTGVRSINLPRSVELQCREEMIWRWLNIPSLSDDVRGGLIEMPTNIQNEVDNLPADPLHDQQPGVPTKSI